MKTQFSLPKITLTAVFAVVLVGISGLGQSSLAQFTNKDSEGYQSNEQDALYGSGSDGFNPMELIHRANLGNGRSSEEFDRDTQQNISNSAADFRKQQLERMNNRNSSTPSTPTSTEPTNK
jgi:hypothetical protein